MVLTPLLFLMIEGALCPPSVLPDLLEVSSHVSSVTNHSGSHRTEVTGLWSGTTISLARLRELGAMNTDAERITAFRNEGIKVFISDRTPDLSEVPMPTWPLVVDQPDLPRARVEASQLSPAQRKMLEKNPALSSANIPSEEASRKIYAAWLDSDEHNYTLGVFVAPDPQTSASFPDSDKPRILLKPHAQKGTILHEYGHYLWYQARKKDPQAIQNPVAVFPQLIKSLENQINALQVLRDNPMLGEDEKQGLSSKIDELKLAHVNASLDYLVAHIGEELDNTRLLAEDGKSFGLDGDYRRHSLLSHAEYLSVAKQYINSGIDHQGIIALADNPALAQKVSQIQNRIIDMRGKLDQSQAWQDSFSRTLGLRI